MMTTKNGTPATAPTAVRPTQMPEPGLARLLFADSRLAVFWLVVRLYVGYEWLTAGWGKITSPDGVWVGERAGTAITGFLNGALERAGGERPSVQPFYGWFVENVALPNATLFSYLVAYGEVLVGIALILGIFTGIAAFFGGLMNANFLLAGTLSSNPVLFILATWLVLAWRVAGWIGLDRWVLPLADRHLAPGKLFHRTGPAGARGPRS